MRACEIPCRDAFGRPGKCTVVVRDREAVLTAPPGETARLSSRQLSELIEALHKARNELFRTES